MKDNRIKAVEEPARESIRERTNALHRILVVEEDPDARQLTVDILTGSGYEVNAVKDGAAGWAALPGQPLRPRYH